MQARKSVPIAVGIALAVMCGLIAWRHGRPADPSAPPPAASPSPGPRPAAPARSAAARPIPPVPSKRAAAAPAARWTAPWGAGPGALGHTRPSEGNPEAPMAFAVAHDGSLWVLDQVNARLVHFGRDGAASAVPIDARAPRDLAVAPDGTLALLDRQGQARVQLLSPTGRAIGALPLAGKGIDQPGAVTSVIVDGDTVYAEREHGQLVALGNTQGQASATRAELQGRPSRDGTSTLLAGIVDRAAGRLVLAVGDRRTGQNRATREIDLGRQVLAIALLDSDLHGTVYLAALQGGDGAAPELLLMCAAESDAHLLGQVPLPANTGPEETTRDLTALDSGGVLYAERGSQGVRFVQVGCP